MNFKREIWTSEANIMIIYTTFEYKTIENQFNERYFVTMAIYSPFLNVKILIVLCYRFIVPISLFFHVNE